MGAGGDGAPAVSWAEMPRKLAGRALPPLVLGKTLDLLEASPLAAALLARRGRDIVIDAATCGRLGGQCLQVLLAARATWAQDGHAFRIAGASAELAEAAALLGATELIGQPHA